MLKETLCFGCRPKDTKPDRHSGIQIQFLVAIRFQILAGIGLSDSTIQHKIDLFMTDFVLGRMFIVNPGLSRRLFLSWDILRPCIDRYSLRYLQTAVE